MNLFATVLTHPAPTANYRGESELNRTSAVGNPLVAVKA